MADEVVDREISSLVAEARYDEALARAMKLADIAMSDDPATGRHDAWRRCFATIYPGFATQYQCQDFEIVDYKMESLPGTRQMFRGPIPSTTALSAGEYICLVGAAQFFGRFHAKSLQELLVARYGMPVLNLSVGGIGPVFFQQDALLSLVRRARLSVVQVLSGRSIGCEEYPGDWLTTRPGETAQLPREVVLREVWERHPLEAVRLMEKWEANYRKSYAVLAKAAGTPSILHWFSPRRPDQWSIDDARREANFGEFPQLVSAAQTEAVKPLFDAYVETVYTAGSQAFSSRKNGQPCPYIWPDGTERWTDTYYPQEQDHRQAFEDLSAVIDERFPFDVPGRGWLGRND